MKASQILTNCTQLYHTALARVRRLWPVAAAAQAAAIRVRCEGILAMVSPVRSRREKDRRIPWRGMIVTTYCTKQLQ